MQDALRTGLRIAGYALIAIAIAHCGDNNNDNTGPRPTQTPGGSRTATPTTVSTSPTPTPDESPSSPTESPTPGPGGACPSGISFVGNADTARLDTGWVGFAHDAKVISRGAVSVATDCGGNPRPCGVCNLSGPIANPDANAGVSNNRRCSGDNTGANGTWIECTSDGDCPGTGNSCAWFFGAPLPLAAGGVSTCVVNQVVGTITGTANIETGEGATSVTLRSSVFLGPALDQPCPICTGDATPADGQRNGTCVEGVRAGMPCDISGTSATFEPKGNTSFDCAPTAGAKVAALPINLSNATSTVTRTLSADNRDCRGVPGKKCFCDTCATAGAEPCSTNADCPGNAECGGKRCQGGTNHGAPCTKSGINSECPGGACGVPGQAPQPNSCDSGTVCEPEAPGSNNGVCAGGPSDLYCGPHETFRGCSVNEECGCPPSDPGCPAAGDTCSVVKIRPCFLDNGDVGGSISAVGAAEVPVNGVSHPTLAALFCIGPTSSGSVNTAAGLPGLGRLQLTGTSTEIP